MSEAIKPTPGPWVVAGENAIEPDVMSGEYFVATCLGFGNQDQALVNARLIAEAGTVAHETGLTPRQLVERVKELKEALSGLLEEVDLAGLGDANDFGWPRVTSAARSALSKSLPNTVAETPT